MVEGTLGVVTVLLGVVVVAGAAAVVHRAGRLIGGIVSPLVLAAGVLVARTVGGRESLVAFALGAVVGLPVLLSVLLPGARPAEVTQADAGPRRRPEVGSGRVDGRAGARLDRTGP